MSKAERITQQVKSETLPDSDVEYLSFEQFVAMLSGRIKSALCPVGEAYLNSPQKRVSDVIGSIALMPLASPIIACAATAIKLEGGGPIFFITRVPGRKREKFGMIKLRTMVSASQSTEGARGNQLFWPKEKNPRITPVGGILREWTMDELPQLINVLRGEMSLVGNRPMFEERINHLGTIDELSDLYPGWVKTYDIAKPGGAGLATARGRGLLDQTPAGLRRRLRYETFYVPHASLGFDLKIIFETMKAVLSRRGAF